MLERQKQEVMRLADLPKQGVRDR